MNKVNKTESTPVNPLDQLSVEEIEAIVLDAEQIKKDQTDEMKAIPRLKVVSDRIKEHRKDPKWKKQKEELDSLKDKRDEIKRTIDADIEQFLQEKGELESPFKKAIKDQNEIIKSGVEAMARKGRVVEIIADQDEEA